MRWVKEVDDFGFCAGGEHEQFVANRGELIEGSLRVISESIDSAVFYKFGMSHVHRLPKICDIDARGALVHGSFDLHSPSS